MIKGNEFPPVPSEISRITDINNFDVANINWRVDVRVQPSKSSFFAL